MKGLIWQDDENIIDVVYQTIYGLPIKEAIHVVKLYQEKQLIPIEWIEKWLDKTTGTRDGEDISQLPEQLKYAIAMINLMEMEWEKENEGKTN